MCQSAEACVFIVFGSSLSLIVFRHPKCAPGNACPNGLLLSLVLFASVTRFWSLMSMLFLSYLGPFHHHIHNSFNSRHLQTRVSFN
ncbi:hypothetical protein HanXRQr2_Chr09g0401261 [Helianthus annuus]|uniref:Uncharacterized protein n=1 Tax=Helianthus annuus TaxID=4232 RepID=A0A9K3I841_HELAN|nr:hypothetical protein HanXRQr2_Chr09g0401261 [Helianthus annuus]